MAYSSEKTFTIQKKEFPMEKHPGPSLLVRYRPFWLFAAASVLVFTIAGTCIYTLTAAHGQGVLPRPDHVVVVMEENHSYANILGTQNDDTAYFNALAQQGAVFTNSHGITHPSEPNYQAIFSGSTQGLTDDSCPHTFSGPNLGSELINANLSFSGYAESLPYTGDTVCSSPIPIDFLATYARKHSPWVNFSNVPSSANMPFSSFPTNYSSLPTVSFVVPNQYHDMHTGRISWAADWLQNNIDSYAQWAKTHNSLLIVTWDEDDNSVGNQIPTIFVGGMVKAGHYNESINHYNVLRTLEDMYGLSDANNSANVPAISDVWQ